MIFIGTINIYETVIECKDYASNVSIEKIDAFVGKLLSVPSVTGIFATKIGYQSGATIKAGGHGIELLVCREQNENDWNDIDKNGNYRLQEISIEIPITLSSSVTVPFKIGIDFSKNIIGIIENISRNRKIIITKDRIFNE